MKTMTVLLTEVLSRKSRLIKGLISTVFLLIFLGMSGCAVTKAVETVPQGDPRGFVEFYVMNEEINKYQLGLPDIYSKEGPQVTLPIFRSRKDRRIIMISRPPGIHRFLITWQTAKNDIEVRVEEGKITPVKIGIARLERESTYINPNVSLETTFPKMYVIIEEMVLFTK